MKKQILSRGAMTLICSAILAACGSNNGNALNNTAMLQNFTTINTELAEIKQVVTHTESQLSDAQKELEDTKQKLLEAQNSGNASADELARLQQKLLDAQTALKIAKELDEAKTKELAKLQHKLGDTEAALKQAQNEEAKNIQLVQDAQTKLGVAQSDLEKAKKDLAIAEASVDAHKAVAQAHQAAREADVAQLKQNLLEAQEALKAAERGVAAATLEAEEAQEALDEAKKQVAVLLATQEALKLTHADEIEAAKLQAVEDYKKSLADTAAAKEKEKEDAKQAEIKTALTSSFGTAENGLMPTKTEGWTNYATAVMSINHQNGTASTAINPEDNTPATKSITVNGTKIALLENVGSDKIALQELEKENTALPAGSGWVGSQISSSSWVPFGKMRFGVYNDNAGSSHLFVTGEEASEGRMKGVEKSVYNFKGSAVIGKDGQYQALPDSISGTVDFHEKNVDLDFAINEQNQHKITGKINGNTFAGESETGVLTKGGFYGYADTLGGFMQINKGAYSGYNGVYGAGQDGRPVKTYP